MNINIIPLDVDNKQHVDFTYEILKERTKCTGSCIVPFHLPSYEDHVINLKSSGYICYYILSYRNIMYGVEYVDRSYRYAIYYIRGMLKSIVRQYKDDPEIKSKEYRAVLVLLLERHPEIKQLTAEINVANSVSFEGAKRLGFKPSYHVLTYTR